MNSQPFVSVAVVVKNCREHIGECIESLVELDYPKDKYEILVIDGKSTDGTIEIVKQISHNVPESEIRIITNEKMRIAPGRNIAINEAKSEYLAFTDSDCKVPPEWLTILVTNILETCEKTVAVGGPNLVFDTDPLTARITGYMQETFIGSGGSPQSDKIKEPRNVISIANCNILYRRKTLEGYMYDNDFNVGEDCELNYRLNRDGYRFLYLPNVSVWHHRRGDVLKFFRNMYHYGAAIIKVSKKHKRPVRFYAAIPSLAIIALLMAYPLYTIFPEIIWVYLLSLTIYLLLLTTATAYVYSKTRSTGSLLTYILLPLQHFAYGLGFFRGISRSK